MSSLHDEDEDNNITATTMRIDKTQEEKQTTSTMDKEEEEEHECNSTQYKTNKLRHNQQHGIDTIITHTYTHKLKHKN